MNNKEDWTSMEKNMQTILDQIREEYPDFWMDEPGLAEDTKAIPTQCQEEREKREAKRLRRHRRRVIAAGFIAVILIGIGTGIFLNSDTAHAMKFAMEKKYYQAKGWVQATDPDRVEDENVMTIKIFDEANVEECKKVWPEILIPKYMTEGYLFNELYIEKHIGGETAIYLHYQSGEKCIDILVSSYHIKDNNVIWMKTDNIRNGQCEYLTWHDSVSETNGIDFISNSEIVSVYGTESLKELEKIVNGLE